MRAEHERRAVAVRGALHSQAFCIESSDIERADGVVLPPDVAPCDACLREVFDPRDRRYRYRFLS